VTAHGQAPRSLDEQHTDVTITARSRVQNAAGHHGVATRLEHQGSADPVKFPHEVLAPFSHAAANEVRPTFRYQSHRVATGVGIDANEFLSRG
jgi:hypothetical protein